MVGLAALVSLANLVCPLVLVYQKALLHLETSIDCRASAERVLLEEVGDIHALLVALQHVCRVMLVELAEAFDDTVLARSIDLLKSLLHLGLQLAALKIALLDSSVLRLNQEAEVLALLLQQPEGASPLDIAAVSLFLDLDDLQVESVVFLGNSFVLLLQRHKRLLVKGLIMLDHLNLVLEGLIPFRCLQQVVEQTLDKFRAGYV